MALEENNSKEWNIEAFDLYHQNGLNISDTMKVEITRKNDGKFSPYGNNFKIQNMKKDHILEVKFEWYKISEDEIKYHQIGPGLLKEIEILPARRVSMYWRFTNF